MPPAGSERAERPAPPVSVPQMLTSLDLTREDEEPALAWLTASQVEDSPLWAQLFEHAERTTGKLKSRLGVAYDLYSDAILRHRAGPRVALLARDLRGQWRSTTYAELDGMVGACASSWISRGVKAGALVAVVMGFRLELVVAVLSALRIGARIALIPPEGARRRSRRLAASKPDHLVLDPQDPADVGAWAAKVLPLVTAGAAPATPPPSFAPSQPVAHVFSPVRAPLDTPVELSAERALLHGLRDSVFAYRLAPGATFAAPGVDLGQYHPALLLSCLLAGATWVHVPIEAIERDPRVMFERPVQVLLVGTRLRDALSGANVTPAQAPSHWLRAVEEPFEWSPWRAFVATLDLQRVPSSTVLVDAADGGCVLFSARRPGSTNLRCLPAAGRPWVLGDVVDATRPAAGTSGIFTPTVKTKPLWPGWFILAKSGSEYIYGGPLSPRRAGRVHPAGLVAEVVTEFPSVRAASVVALPAGGTGSKFVLCVFGGAVGAGPEEAAVRGRVAAEVGPDGAPDRVEVLPLLPHWKGPAVDGAWVRAQYSLGRLQAKAGHPVFQRLMRLREALAGA